MRALLNKLIVLPILLCAISSIKATSNNELFARANDAYAKASYDSAIILYNHVLEAGFEAPALYYNLGNAYFKTKNIARAILNYERAYQLSPNDDDILFNLQLAQTMIVDKINVLPQFFLVQWWRSLSLLMSSNAWAILSIGLFTAVLLALMVYFFARLLWLKKLAFFLSCILFLGSLIAFTHSYAKKSEIENHASAIVITPTISIKSSPDEKGTDIFVLHEGIKVQIVDEVGQWLKIKIADGNAGWLKKDNIERI